MATIQCGIVLLIFVASVSSVTYSPIGSCVDQGDGTETCYYYTSDTLSWNDANASCAADLNGELMTIQDQTEQQFLRDNLVGTPGYVFNSHQPWIGLSVDSYSDWTWQDGSQDTGSWSKWTSNYPQGNNYVRMTKSEIPNDNYLWTDAEAAAGGNSYICQDDDIANCMNTTDTVAVLENGKCFRAHFQAVSTSWYASRTACQENSTGLAVIKGDSAFDSMKQALTSREADFPTQITGGFWIGLSREDWVWIDGSFLAYSNWEANSPTTAGLCAHLEIARCVGDLCPDFVWLNRDCSSVFPSICEERRPIPTTAESTVTSGSPEGTTSSLPAQSHSPEVTTISQPEISGPPGGTGVTQSPGGTGSTQSPNGTEATQPSSYTQPPGITRPSVGTGVTLPPGGSGSTQPPGITGRTPGGTSEPSGPPGGAFDSTASGSTLSYTMTIASGTDSNVSDDGMMSPSTAEPNMFTGTTAPDDTQTDTTTDIRTRPSGPPLTPGPSQGPDGNVTLSDITASTESSNSTLPHVDPTADTNSTDTVDVTASTSSEGLNSTDPEGSTKSTDSSGTKTSPFSGTGPTEQPGTGSTPSSGTGSTPTPGTGSTPAQGTVSTVPPVDPTADTNSTDAADVTAPSSGDGLNSTDMESTTTTTDSSGTKSSFSGTGSPGTGSTPSPGTGSTPSPGTGSTPSPGTGSTPSPGTGSTPSPGTGSTPSPGTGSTPSPGTGSTPSPGTGSTPSQGTGSTPSQGTGSTPSPGTGSTPSPGTGSTPSQGTGSTPSQGTGSTPSQGTGSTPSQGTGPTQPGGTGTPGPTEPVDPTGGGGTVGGLSAGAIAGIVVGCVAGVVLILLLIICLVKRARRKRREREYHETVFEDRARNGEVGNDYAFEFTNPGFNGNIRSMSESVVRSPNENVNLKPIYSTPIKPVLNTKQNGYYGVSSKLQVNGIPDYELARATSGTDPDDDIGGSLPGTEAYQDFGDEYDDDDVIDPKKTIVAVTSDPADDLNNIDIAVQDGSKFVTTIVLPPVKSSES